MEEQTQTPVEETTTTTETTETPAEQPQEQQPIRFVTKEQFKKIKKMQAHAQKVEKAKELRRQQPNANAKIEDLNDILRLMQQRDNDLFILAKTLYRLGIIKESDVQETREYETNRAAKFEELSSPACTLSKEEKLAVAKEWNLPLALLGLEEPVEAPSEAQKTEETNG